MPHFTFCPQCNTKYRTAGMPAFKRLRCKKCQGIFVVPEDSAEQSLAAAPQKKLDAQPDKDAEHAIPAAIGDSSALGRANFKGGVTLDDVAQVSNLRYETDDTIEGLPRPVEKRIEAAIKPAATDEKYIVEGEIARGGMGVILKAADRDIRRPVAMKVMLDAKSPKDKARFVEEAQVTGQLEHPNIVPIHELGIDAEGRLFFTMKLVKGRSLKEILDALRDVENPQRRKAAQQQRATRDGRQAGSPKPETRDPEPEFSLGRLLNAFTNICNAMAFAHAKGVVHRDLKPANIMLGDYGEVLVMDWGLAKVVSRPLSVVSSQQPIANSQKPLADSGTDSRDEQLRRVVSSVRDEAGGSLTMDGTILGTPHYMPPEQADGKIEEIDARSDIYSLGAMLYEILALKTPCEGKGVFALIKNVSEGNITPPDQRAPKHNIPKELSAITMKALARRKEDRYQRVEDLRRDIELFIEGRAVSAKEDTFAESVVKLVKRNKTASVVGGLAAAVLLVVLAGSAWINYEARRRAENALSERDKEQARRMAEEAARREEQKKSVPAFVEGARAALAARRFDDALAQMNVALEYDPDNADAHLMKGQLLIFRADHPGARAELEAYLRQKPDDADAKALAELCKRAKAGDSRHASLFAEILLRQKAYYFAESLTRDAQKLLPAYRLRLDAAWAGAGSKLGVSQEGSFELSLYGRKDVTELEPLRGMPLTRLVLAGCGQLRDLSPLRGMPLTRLDLGGLGQVKDLSPLKGMPLTWLSLGGCALINDLSPLQGMPLTSLEVGGCAQISDLTPLKGMPLTWISFSDCRQLRDLSPLDGMPLMRLNLFQCGLISDLRALKDMPLEELNLANTGVTDLTPLEGMRLDELIFSPKNIRQGMAAARMMKSLGKIGIHGAAWPPPEFWKKYDAGEFK